MEYCIKIKVKSLYKNEGYYIFHCIIKWLKNPASTQLCEKEILNFTDN